MNLISYHIMTGNFEDFSNVQYKANKFNFEFVVLWVVTPCNSEQRM